MADLKTLVPVECCTQAEFLQYVETNTPVIIGGDLISGWMNQENGKRTEWTLEKLAQVLGSYRFANAFVSTDGRFKYFKQGQDDQKAAPETENLQKSISTADAEAESIHTDAEGVTESDQCSSPPLLRVSLDFQEFLRRSGYDADEKSGADITQVQNVITQVQNVNNQNANLSATNLSNPKISAQQAMGHIPFLSPSEQLYIYGEPLPGPLESHFNSSLSILKDVDLTSTLLWVATRGNISPLHYDLSEGVLAQLSGTKRFLLFPPTADNYDSLYPYPLDHKHDRQSQINDIHNPDIDQFPKCKKVNPVEAVVGPGQLIYIPYGWWHQVESSGVSISLTQRWNPYANDIKQILITNRGLSNMPAPVRDLIIQQMLNSLPPVVALLLKLRHVT